MRTPAIRYPNLPGPARQRGIVATFLALVVLVVTLIAVIALMRSVDTANSLAGTMSFRQGVVQEAEVAYADARAKLVFVPPTSETDNAGNHYYASIQTAAATRPDLPAVLTVATPDPLKVGPQLVPNALTANRIWYVVERICPTNGAATPTTCIVPGKALTGGTSSNATSDPGIPFNNTGQAAAFRLTVRVDGPKNSRAFVQTIFR